MSYNNNYFPNYPPPPPFQPHPPPPPPIFIYPVNPHFYRAPFPNPYTNPFFYQIPRNAYPQTPIPSSGGRCVNSPYQNRMNMQQERNYSQWRRPEVLHRGWEWMAQDYLGGEQSFKFSVMSYNVLSPLLQEAHKELYEKCESLALNWSYRKSCFWEEMKKYSADILCLQEIESELLEEYNQGFKSLGYVGVYKKRGGDVGDGCAIYYKESMFRLEDCIGVTFFQKRKQVQIMDRVNVALAVKLAPIVPNGHSSKIVVATTHLLFNPKRTDVKFAQMKLLLAELDRISCYGLDKKGKPKYYPTIITGDFNVEPNNAVSSLVREGDRPDEFGSKSIPPHLGISDQCQHYQVLHQRALNQQNSEFHTNFTDSHVNHDLSKPVFCNLPLPSTRKERGAQEVHEEEEENLDPLIANHPEPSIVAALQEKGLTCTFGSGKTSHAFNFKDVYEDDTHKFVTARQRGWVRVDYIYYGAQGGALQLLRRLNLPTKKDGEHLGAIPRLDVSSDHFLLMAQFSLKPQTTSK